MTILLINPFGDLITTLVGTSTIGLPINRSRPLTLMSAATITTSASSISLCVKASLSESFYMQQNQFLLKLYLKQFLSLKVQSIPI